MLSFLIVLFINVMFCQYSSWMYDMNGFNGGNSGLLGNLYNKTVFDVVWPGSNDAGMYTVQANLSQDDLGQLLTNNLIYSRDEKESWSLRQTSSILTQLQAGSRFFNLKFEYVDSSNTFYTHQGLFGATLNDILSNFTSFGSSTDDISIISINSFLHDSSSSFTRDEQLRQLLTSISDTLNSLTISNTSDTDLSGVTLNDLHSSGVRYILFTDEYPSTGDNSNFTYSYYNGSELFVGDESSDNSTARSHAVDVLRTGWDYGTLNRIYWSEPITSLVSATNFYSSFWEYNLQTLLNLRDTIQDYPKLRFGNIIMVDFIDSSDVVEQAIILNWQQMSCNDDNLYWDTSGSGCPDRTNLFTDYYYKNLTDVCQGDASLRSECRRSCGDCPYPSGLPGQNCSSNSDCSSDYYTYIGNTGKCYKTNESESFYITESSFCLTAFPSSLCGDLEYLDRCEVLDGVTQSVDTSGCDLCVNNYQCNNGYCSSDFGACFTVTDAEFATPAPIGGRKPNFKKSSLAKDFRSDIEFVRPGDPDAKYSLKARACTNYGDCLDLMDENPYLTSLIGFILVPFILSLFLYFCYTICCINWCCCDNCSKRCCCRCLGDPKEKNKDRKYIPLGLLVCTLCIILWACIEGIQANSKMHDDIFGDDKSVKSEIGDVVDVVINKFGGVDDIANTIFETLNRVLNNVENVLDSTADVANAVNGIVLSINNMSKTYGKSTTFSATVTDPFLQITVGYNLTCDYCDGLSDTLSSLNNSLASSANEAVDLLSDALNSSYLLVQARDEIEEVIGDFNNATASLLETIYDIKNTSDEQFDKIKPFDKKFREQSMFYFFSIPLVFWIFPIIGYILQWKWCLKINWCLAMYIGSTVMFIFSFFAIFSVSWADFCVRLDDFEKHLPESQFGRILSNNLGNKSSTQMFEIVNACFYGTSLLEVFDLDEKLDWDSFRENISDALEIDVAKYLESNELDEFQTELALLSTDEYTKVVDDSIDALNENNGCNCTSDDLLFDRKKILNNSCIQNWNYTYYLLYKTECITLYTEASYSVQAENQTIKDIQNTVDGMKASANSIFDAYDAVFELAVSLENALVNISCIIDPLFDEFDIILNNYTNCLFVGEIYNGFKKIGCTTLFGDMYYISRAMMNIAFFSILVVLFSMMVDYIISPPKNKKKDKERRRGSDLDMMEKELETSVDSNESGNVEMMNQFNSSKRASYMNNQPRTQQINSYSYHNNNNQTPNQPAPPMDEPPPQTYSDDLEGPGHGAPFNPGPPNTSGPGFTTGTNDDFDPVGPSTDERYNNGSNRGVSVSTTKTSLEEYLRKEKLGEGTYGVVYKCKHKPTGRYVALKKIKIDPHEEGIPATTLREVSLLKELKHPCIIELERSLYVEGDLFLVFAYMDNDLKQYLDNCNSHLELKLLKSFSFLLLEGVRFCHSNRILHRDLKPQNILISRDGLLKIADFGLGREHGIPIGKLTHEVVTLWYRPPEILLGQDRYSGAADIWGVACIIAEMATRKALFPGDSEIDQIFQIFRVLGTPNDSMWPNVSKLKDYKPNFPLWKPKDLSAYLRDSNIDSQGIDLIKKMLFYPPNKRITAKHALLHPWFADIRQNMYQKLAMSSKNANIFPTTSQNQKMFMSIKNEVKVTKNNKNNNKRSRTPMDIS